MLNKTSWSWVPSETCPLDSAFSLLLSDLQGATGKFPGTLEFWALDTEPASPLPGHAQASLPDQVRLCLKHGGQAHRRSALEVFTSG